MAVEGAAGDAAGLKLPSAIQIALVVADLDRSMRIWHDVYGVGPWAVFDLSPERMDAQTIDGEPASYAMRLALASWGPVQVELIEPSDDESIYARSLAERGADHLHHVQCAVDDYDRTVEALADRGRHSVQGGEMFGATFSYVGTEPDLGFPVEIAKRRHDFALPAPDSVYPPAQAVSAADLYPVAPRRQAEH